MPTVRQLAIREEGEGMKPFIIEKGRSRLYFDPSTSYIRIDYAGAGPGIELTDEERTMLSKALWYAKRPR
jgi:hypothetical protein